MDPTERIPRSAVLPVGLIAEGSLGVLAIGLGAWIGPPPLDRFVWNLSDGLLGAAAVLPMLALLTIALRSRWAPLVELRRFFDEVARPILADCTVIDFALLSIAAGVGEELLFRGWLQPGLGGVLGPVGGWIMASLLFGFAHPLTTAYVVTAAVLGAYLGACLIGTDNLLTPIVAHALYDFLALVWLIKMRRDPASPAAPGSGSIRPIGDEPHRVEHRGV